MNREGARRFTWDDVLPAALALLALVIGVAIFASFLLPFPVQVGYDEGYEAAGVERILDGRGLPYVDAFSIRGPFLYWSLAILHLVTGRFQWTGTRLIGLLSCAAVVVNCYFAGWAARWTLAGAVGGAIYVFIAALCYAPGGGIGVHSEPVAIAYLTAAMFLIAYALYRARTPRRRTILLVAGGALVAVAGLTKQPISFCSLPFLFWIVMRANIEVAETTPDGWPRWRTILLRWALPFVAGGLGLVVLVLLRYALAGELGTFLFWSIGVGTKIYMAPYKGHVAALTFDWVIAEPWAALGGSLGLVIGLGPALNRVTEWSLRGVVTGFGQAAFETVVGLTGVLLMLAAGAAQRIGPHYFLPTWAFFGLVLGVLMESIAVRGSRSPRAGQAVVVAIIGAVLIAGCFERIGQLKSAYAAGSYHNPRPNPACAAIDRIAGPGREEIFIWGVEGDLYVTCQRRSASMWTHTIMIMGMVPPFWNIDLDRVPAGSREQLLAELTAKPPKVIIDHPINGGDEHTMMMGVPMYANFLSQRYCQVEAAADSNKGRSLIMYARRDLPACQGR